ncbi:MAG TPA: iron-containing alcohol dehydrogenase [Candidatus Limnocylindrales bacterium]|nr:iron-containing alcohol dehydrogenase [Candidatus Limnocylindrales bacterium]
MGEPTVVTGPSFEFATAARIVVGAGESAQLPSIVSGLGSRALVCTGSQAQRHAELLDRLAVPYTTFAVSGEPTLEIARAATAVAGEYGADIIIGIGGGSVLDLGKAVAMLLGNGGDPLDYLEVVGRGQKITQASRSYIAVPTTAGTGAEVTANATLVSPEHGIKASLRSPLMLPRVALVDPLLALSCPPQVTAASGLDALTQCLEPLVSIKANPLTDALAAQGLRHAAAGLRRAYADGGDRSARTDMAVCSLLGGLALANAKLGAVHGFAGVVGAMFDVPHGAACAALLAPVVEVNVRALRRRQPGNPALERYAQAARLLTGGADASIDDGLAWIRETVALLNVAGLDTFGLRGEQADEVVAKAAKSSSMQGNPIALQDDELHEILAEAA